MSHPHHHISFGHGSGGGGGHGGGRGFSRFPGGVGGGGWGWWGPYWGYPGYPLLDPSIVPPWAVDIELPPSADSFAPSTPGDPFAPDDQASAIMNERTPFTLRF